MKKVKMKDGRIYTDFDHWFDYDWGRITILVFKKEHDSIFYPTIEYTISVPTDDILEIIEGEYPELEEKE